MNTKIVPIKQVLISVSNKDGVLDFARALHQLGGALISAGKTAAMLSQARLPVKTVADITGFPEMMNGRVKTLHPKIQGGILGLRDKHRGEAEKMGIPWIDLVICNCYPFAQAIQKPGVNIETALENIDIGGPTMIRGAAKNQSWVTVVVDPQDYEWLLQEIKKKGGVCYRTRQKLATKAFNYTAVYDSLIHHYLCAQTAPKTLFPATLNLTYEKVSDLRYGENPQQQAALYQSPLPASPSLLQTTIHQGKPLSYNNIVDANAALAALREFKRPACVVVKHANPGGVATGSDIAEAFKRAYQADAPAAFGGIIALNRVCTPEIARELNQVFIEIILAPAYESSALKLLAQKPRVRVLELGEITPPTPGYEYTSIPGGLLAQENDARPVKQNSWRMVTKTSPSPQTWDDLLFAWQVVKHVKSNAIVIAKNQTTLGIGAGQVSRIDAVTLAIQKARGLSSGAVLASDGFFPFRDSIDAIAPAGIAAVIQPGGSLRDPEVIQACDEHKLAMVFTGIRCFKH